MTYSEKKPTQAFFFFFFLNNQPFSYHGANNTGRFNNHMTVNEVRVTVCIREKDKNYGRGEYVGTFM